MKIKTLTKWNILALTAVLVVCAALVVVSIKQAIKLSRMHDEMRLFVDSIPTKRLETLNARYLDGFSVYYSLNDYSGIYPKNLRDTLYEELEMDRWAVEVSDETSSIRLLVPEIGWDPPHDDIENGGWFLSGEVGSSITLDNPRLDPSDWGRLWLEVIDRNEQGVVFVIGKGRADKPRNVL